MRQLIDATLKKHLTGQQYQADKAPELCKLMTQEIITGVKRTPSLYHSYIIEF